jgi:hypothetical protein
MTDKPTLSPEARAALMQCFATRGKNKGLLLSRCPSPFKEETKMAYAAWQGAMMACNPFKASVMAAMFLDAEQSKIRLEVTAYLDARPALAKVLDKDRMALETLGVW